jgi:hypothetical protein
MGKDRKILSQKVDSNVMDRGVGLPQVKKLDWEKDITILERIVYKMFQRSLHSRN